MRVFTHVTSSHRPMLDKFWLPSLRRLQDHGDSITPIVFESNIGGDGLPGSSLWIDALVERNEKIYEELCKSDEPLACIDADVVFFRPMFDYLQHTLQVLQQAPGGLDILAAQDGSGGLLQAGAMVLSPTEAVKTLYAGIGPRTLEIGNDQPAFQQSVRLGHVKMSLLPRSCVWYLAYADSKLVWRPEEAPADQVEARIGSHLDKMPPDAMCFHAARVLSVECKMATLAAACRRQGLAF